MTKWFQRRSHFKRKNIKNKYRELQLTHVCFLSQTVATWEVLVLDRLLSSVFVISLRKKAPTSHFYSLQHVENGKEKN